MRYPLAGALVGAAVFLVLSASCQEGNELGWLHAEHTGDLTYAPAPRERFDRTIHESCGETAVSAVFLRRPYLQRVTDEGAWVLWTSSSDAPVTLVIRDPSTGEKSEFASAIDESAPIPGGKQLVAQAHGLLPGRVYCYELRDQDGVLAAAGFRSAPAGPNATVQFVALGDLGQRGIDQLAVLEQLQTVPYELVLMAGDVAYDNGRLDELESNFFDVYAPIALLVPLMMASGNHEYGTDDAAPFRQAFALFDNGDGDERWYSFDWGPLHVAVLDTERTGAVQAAWLDGDLERSTAPWKIVLLHRPPFSSGHHGSDEPVQQTFVPLFERHRVRLVLAGHDHDYERTDAIAGVTYVVTGGGGVGTRPVDSSWFTAFSERVSHFVHVTVDESTLTLRAIDATGADFDSLRLVR